MNDLEQIRDALESAKTFLGQEILWKESNYVRGHGEKKYSELCVALSIIDRMIETPAPTNLIQDMRDFREKAELIGMVNKLVADNNRLLNKKSSTPAPQDAPMLTGDIKVGVTTFRQGVKLSTVQACIDSHINSMPKTAPTEKVDYKQLKQLVFRWAADVNGAPLDSDICEIINIIRRTEKVEGIDGLFDAVSVEDLPPPNTDEECDNITKRYQSHEAIYGCAVSETLLEAARAYLKLQSGETEKVDVDALKKTFEPSSIMDNSVKVETLNYVCGWNACIDHLANTGRLR